MVNGDGDRRRATDLLGSLLLGLVAAQVLLRILLHGLGTGLGADLLADALLWLAGLVWAGRAAQERRLRVWSTGLEAPLLLYAIVCGASPLVAGHKMPAFEGASSVWSSVLLYLLLVNHPDRRQALTAAVALITGAALANVLLGFDQVFRELPALRGQYPPGVPIPGVEPEHEQELRWRMETGEATGTFVLSNTLAAFLLLALPAAVALAVRAWRRDARGEAVAWTGLGAALVAGLWSTGSVGGGVAAVVALLAYGALALWSRDPRARGLLLAAAAVALVATAVLGAAGVLTPARLRAAHPSLAFRADFWSAALRVVDERPFLGVGLGNFCDHYTRWKSAAAQETVRAHSVFLDAWAETGLVGFAAFVAIWIVVLVLALRLPAASGGGGGPPPKGLARRDRVALIAGAMGGGILAYMLSSGAWLQGGASLVAWLAALAVAGAWMAWLTGRGVEPASVAPALAAGALGFLLHAAIDIDWSVPAMTGSVLALLAAWTCAREPDPPAPAIETPLRLPGMLAALVPFVVATLVLVAFLVPRAMRADAQFDRAGKAFDEARKASETGRAAKTDEEKRAAARLVIGRYREATRCLMEAQAANPWDARLFEALSRYAAAVLPAFEREASLESEVEFEMALKAIDDAIALCPDSAGLRAQKGTLWDIRADLLGGRREREKDEGRRERIDRRQQAAVAAALEAYDGAVERYPTRAWYRFLRGTVYYRLGRSGEEQADLRRALELHEAQPLERLRLPADIERGVRERLKEIARGGAGQPK
jgi:putative inorganic carbon (hco3(-)) transporter